MLLVLLAGAYVPVRSAVLPALLASCVAVGSALVLAVLLHRADVSWGVAIVLEAVVPPVLAGVACGTGVAFAAARSGEADPDPDDDRHAEDLFDEAPGG